jgi:ubiquinone biosynthesis protein
MWEVAAPYVRDWIRDELGPEAAIADRIRENVKTLLRLPDLVRRIDERVPAKGGAPEDPPLPPFDLIWQKRRRPEWLGHIVVAAAGAAAGAALMAGTLGLGLWG